MGQSTYRWVIIIDDFGDVSTLTVVSTAEDLPNVVDFTANIVSIVRVDFA